MYNFQQFTMSVCCFVVWHWC